MNLEEKYVITEAGQTRLRVFREAKGHSRYPMELRILNWFADEPLSVNEYFTKMEGWKNEGMHHHRFIGGLLFMKYIKRVRETRTREEKIYTVEITSCSYSPIPLWYEKRIGQRFKCRLAANDSMFWNSPVVFKTVTEMQQGSHSEAANILPVDCKVVEEELWEPTHHKMN